MKKHYLFTSLLAAATLSVTSINAQNITTYIGNGINVPGGSDNTQHTTSIKPFGMFMTYLGDVFISDYNNHKMKEMFTIDTSVRTIAGSATSGFTGEDVNGTGAQLNLPAGVWCTYAGDTAYFCDAGNNAIRRLVNSGSFYTIKTVVNTSGTAGNSGDGGPAASAKLTSPQSIFRDVNRNLYIADQGNHSIRKVDNAGNITTIAGTGTAGFSGDGGLATSAQLNLPTGLFVDTAGNVYIADYGNNRIRKIDATTGMISTVAGSGTAGSSGDGAAATSAQLNGPSGVYVFAGTIYIADKMNHKIRMVNTSGTISTLAGTGTAGFGGDGGAAASAQLSSPTSVYVTNYHSSSTSYSGIYVCDQGNLRIRRIELPDAVQNTPIELASHISPNPSNGQFTITLPTAKGTVSVAISNVVGTIVYTSQIVKGKLQVDMTAQPAGVYFVHLTSGNTTATQKIVVNK